MKTLTGTLFVALITFFVSTHSTILAFNENQAACSIPSTEFVSLIQSVNRAEEQFLYATDELVPRMWEEALLGFNDSLDEPFESEALTPMILRLRDEHRIIPELELFLRTPEAHKEQNARDFFLFVSSLCQRGLLTKATYHTERAIRRAYASLNDPYSTYLTPAEAARYVLESVPEMNEGESSEDRRGLEYVGRLSENIYILKINSFFSQQVANEVHTALEQIVAECSFPNIILDLRDNLGGFTDASIGVSRSFLRNKTIVQFENRDGSRESFVADADDNNFHLKSTTVLVNHNTASAAEIVTAALDENGALVVGTVTYGKALGQRVQHLSNGWATRITSFRVYSPLGNSWQDTGITPEIDTAMFVFSFTNEEPGSGIRSDLSASFVDPLVLATHQLIREGVGWDPRCGP